MDDTQKTLAAVSRAVTQEGTAFTIDVKPRSRAHALAQRLRLSPKKVTYRITPSVIGTMARISALVLSLDLPELSQENFREVNYQLARDHGRDFAEIVALAITNNVELPKKSLIDFLLYNLTPKEMLAAVTIVLVQLDTSNFISSIASMRSLNVLGRNAKRNESAEASQQMTASS